jgi:hypothetical protein
VHKNNQKTELRFRLFYFPVFRNQKWVSGLICPEQNKSTKRKNFFPEIHPPDVFIWGKTQSLLSTCLVREVLGRPPPRLKQRAADRRRGRCFHKERLLQKIFVQNDEKK